MKEYVKYITNFQKNAEKARINAWILSILNMWFLIYVLPLIQYKMKKVA